MQLTDDEVAQLAADLYVQDVTGEALRLVEADERGNLSRTGHAADLVEVYHDVPLRWVCFDPVVFFGPGERYVNDGEAELMRVAWFIHRQLPSRPAVGYIAHMSKAGTKEKDDSAHAGRGGAAFGDNSRGLLVIHRYDSKQKTPTPPTGIDAKAITAGRVHYLTVAKLSHGVKVQSALFFVRGEHDGFDFELFAPDDIESREEKQREVTQEWQMQQMALIYTAVARSNGEGNNPITSKSALREMTERVSPGRLVGRDRFSGLVDMAETLGYIRQEELPEDERHGARKWKWVAVKYPDGSLGANPLAPGEWQENGPETVGAAADG
jgi:RecA-family ATPase